MYKSPVPLLLTPRAGGAGYSWLVQDSPGVGVDNRRQLEKSGVSSVTVLGTLPETAFSLPWNEMGQECLSSTSFYLMVGSEINVPKLIIICCSYFFLLWPLTLPSLGSIVPVFSKALCARLLQLQRDCCPPLVPRGSHFSPVTLYISLLPTTIQMTMSSTVPSTWLGNCVQL